jgi:hypothetical protein
LPQLLGKIAQSLAAEPEWHASSPAPAYHPS